MKHLILLSLMFLSIGAFAEEKDKYTKTMESIVSQLDTAETKATLVKAANKLERIAAAEKDKWLPYYYAAFSNLAQLRFEKDSDNGNKMLEKVDRFITIADSLSPDNSEIYVLRGWYYSSNMQFGGSPMKYGPLSSNTIQKAIELDNNNPRAHSFKGMNTFYTPAAFGGGKDKAKPIFETSLTKFATFQPETSIHPRWGKEMTELMYEKCSEDKEKEKDE